MFPLLESPPCWLTLALFNAIPAPSPELRMSYTTTMKNIYVIFISILLSHHHASIPVANFSIDINTAIAIVAISFVASSGRREGGGGVVRFYRMPPSSDRDPPYPVPVCTHVSHCWWCKWYCSRELKCIEKYVYHHIRLYEPVRRHFKVCLLDLKINLDIFRVRYIITLLPQSSCNTALAHSKNKEVKIISTPQPPPLEGVKDVVRGSIRRSEAVILCWNNWRPEIFTLNELVLSS